MSETKRAPWYRVSVKTPGGDIDVTLSDVDERAMMACIVESGKPFQLWAQRHNGSVESLTVAPGPGVKTTSRAALAIPVMPDGRPAQQGQAATAAVSPEQDKYAEVALPARLVVGVPYLPTLQQLANDLSTVRGVLWRRNEESTPKTEERKTA